MSNSTDTPPPAQQPRARGRPRGWDDKTDQNTIKSLDRAMAVLDHLSRHSGQPLSQLAGDLEQSPATVYRVLSTLQLRGIVEFTPSDQHWHIGPQAFVIGARFLRRTSLVDRARPILRRLMEATGETANLGVVQGASVLFVSQVETHATIRAFFPPGTLSPLHASGIGKALMAHMPPDRLDRLLAGASFDSFTPFTLTDPQALRADLSATRARGYAIDAEEKTLGMRCIAAPVFDVHAEGAAGLSVSGPTIRLDARQTEPVARHVRDAAAALTQAIGGRAIDGRAIDGRAIDDRAIDDRAIDDRATP